MLPAPMSIAIGQDLFRSRKSTSELPFYNPVTVTLPIAAATAIWYACVPAVMLTVRRCSARRFRRMSRTPRR